MINTREETLEFLNIFCDNYPTIDKPFPCDLTIGKYTCATDRGIIILMPETDNSRVEKEYGINYPDVFKVIPIFSEPIKLDYQTILSKWNDIPFVEENVTIDCDYCDGEGSFDHFGYDYECKHCAGIGFLRTDEVKMVKQNKTYFKFGDTHVDAKYIEKLLLTVHHFGEDSKLELLFINGKIIWFKVSDIFVAIAACVLSKVEDNHIINIEI